MSVGMILYHVAMMLVGAGLSIWFDSVLMAVIAAYLVITSFNDALARCSEVECAALGLGDGQGQPQYVLSNPHGPGDEHDIDPDDPDRDPKMGFTADVKR